MKKLILLLIIPFLSFGQTNTCIDGDCENGWGTIAWDDGVKFIGEFKKGKIYSGNGKVCCWKDGSYFVGKYENNERVSGEMFDENGNLIFEGQWKNNQEYSGNGKVIIDKDNMFEGEWKEGKWWNGNGKIITEGGAKCNIYYEDGKEKKRICNHNNIRKSEDIISGPESKKINLMTYSDNPNAYYMSLTINNKKVKFHFDTGCSIFTVNLTQWEQLQKGLDYEDLNVVGNSKAVGSTHHTKYYKILEPIEIDDFSIKNVIIGVTQLNSIKETDESNLIGIGFFKKFSNVIWNMNKGTLEIYK